MTIVDYGDMLKPVFSLVFLYFLFLFDWQDIELGHCCVFPQCLKQYVELLINEGLETAISCPDSACPKRGHLQENEVLYWSKEKFYFLE